MFKDVTNTKHNFIIPGTILIIGLIISSGIFLYRSASNRGTEGINKNIPEDIGLKPLTADDKILGNPSAEVIIIEYSDFECPFCKSFHQTMNDIMTEYGRTGKVAWVFRHFPLEIHKNAKDAAIASECVYRISGNESFWEYSNILFSTSTDILSKENLMKIATDEMSIEEEQFSACMQNQDVLNKIDSDIADGKIIYENDPNFGTPYSFIITKSGIQTKVIGDHSFSEMKLIIDSFI